MREAVLETSAGHWPKRQGKVRDVYDLGSTLALVATDRISAFDWVLPNGIPGKGIILTQMSLWWFCQFRLANHLITDRVDELPPEFDRRVFAGRTLIVHKLAIVLFECVVRGYLAGSGWKEYRERGTVCGQKLPSGLREGDRLPEPIFTPATKAEVGHDENVSVAQMEAQIGAQRTESLRNASLHLYRRAAEIVADRGLILADTKFEFGLDDHGELVLADEVLTPDSSRYWPAESYRPGGPQASFDKQYVRDWLESVNFDKQSIPPPLPDEVVAKTLEKYMDAYRRVTGASLELI